MLDVIEDSRNEFKKILNEKLEKEVISFLTAAGGNIYIGVTIMEQWKAIDLINASMVYNVWVVPRKL